MVQLDSDPQLSRPQHDLQLIPNRPKTSHRG